MIYGSGLESTGRTCDIGPRPTPEQLVKLGWKQTRGGNWKHPTYARGGVTFDSAQCIVVGKIVHDRILKRVPALAKAMEDAKKEAEQGYVIGLDGRKLWMRQSFGRVQTHKALNTKLQSSGALVMAKATELLYDSANKEGLRYQLICYYHDEWSILAHPDDAKAVGRLSELAIINAGKYFNLNVDLDAEAAYGLNWAETH